ncbi:hypothetical protein I79_024587 [Cricetulus griseus]|uniref:Uncharacterized protein n=1 Tax=Cricetulus griseus TaxID=10029 RepID=G3IL27_CRIGR|nr:hypothetical protein I79_024587 [Cricetulus griseus]
MFNVIDSLYQRYQPIVTWALLFIGLCWGKATWWRECIETGGKLHLETKYILLLDPRKLKYPGSQARFAVTPITRRIRELAANCTRLYCNLTN